MAKVIALLNTIAWMGFWAFGYIAFTTSPEQPTNMVMAALLAAMGGAFGLWAYFWLIRHSEATGYAKPRNRARLSEEAV
ncbi:hypothetical protein [Primorskyibacter sp. S187A]|uniref:hypothetical protein n=1 Tax=Primorskyibacter sp. S187A TaxID=3415130 RepID=UPI003C7B3F09